MYPFNSEIVLCMRFLFPEMFIIKLFSVCVSIADKIRIMYVVQVFLTEEQLYCQAIILIFN